MKEQIGFALRLAAQRHTAIFIANMLEKLTPPQFAALATLLEHGSCSQNEFGRMILLDAATVKGIVDRQRAHGLIVVKRDDTDRRRSTIALTEIGRNVAERATVTGAEITKATLAPLKPAGRRLLLPLLRKISGVRYH